MAGRALPILLAAILLAGCASQGGGPLYSWGDYQPLIYKMYVKPGTATPAEQVNRLSQDIEKAGASDRQVAPGVHAQLGYMAYQDGKPGLAAEQFQAERELYPESGVFMNRLLSRLHESKP